MAKSIKDMETVVPETFEKITEIANNIIDEKVINNIEETVEPVIDTETEAAEKLKLEIEAAEKLKLETEAAEKLKLETEAAEKLKLEAEAAEKLKLETETLEEGDIIHNIIQILKEEHYYSHLRCGIYLKENIDKKNLKLFYNEFVSYGISSNNDSEIIKNIELLFKK